MHDQRPMPGSWPEDGNTMVIDGESDVCETEAVANPSMTNLESEKKAGMWCSSTRFN